MKSLAKHLISATLMLAILTLLTGVMYPLVITGIALAMFPKQAKGSLIHDGEGKIIGSALIAQPFTDPKYFWPRPSATSPGYNGGASSGSNQGPTNPALLDAVKSRVEALKAADPGNSAPVPVDLVTASASGLDPHISPAAAEYQVARVARARGIGEDRVRTLAIAHTARRQLGFLGEPRVNVLELNLALDTQ